MTVMRVPICPKCLTPMEVDEDEASYCGECSFAGDPVSVPLDLDNWSMEPFRRTRDSLVALERFKLAQIEREDDFRLAERRWYENLSVADRFWEDSRRKRVRRERMEAASPMERSLMRLMEWGWEGSLTRQLYRDDPLLDWIRHPWPKPDALDVWLAEDNPRRFTHYGVPGPLETLGLA